MSGSLPELTGLVDALDGPSVIGVYVFFADGEQREAGGPRIVRLEIRTAVSVGANTTLWNRLSAHRGTERFARRWWQSPRLDIPSARWQGVDGEGWLR